jgi:hypothetical protein
VPEITELHFDALLKQGERTLGAIESLGVEIRALAQAMVKGFARDGVQQSNGTQAFWPVLIGVAGIMFGLLTPVYLTVDTQSGTMAALAMAMRKDDDRERTDAAELAALRTGLTQVAEQFKFTERLIGVNATAEMGAIAKLETWTEAHDRRVLGLNAAQWERIRFLEMQVFDKSLPVIQGLAKGSEEQR